MDMYGASHATVSRHLSYMAEKGLIEKHWEYDKVLQQRDLYIRLNFKIQDPAKWSFVDELVDQPVEPNFTLLDRVKTESEQDPEYL